MELLLKIHHNLIRFTRLNLINIKEVCIDTFIIAFLDIFLRFSYQYLGWLSYLFRPLGLCCLAILFYLRSRYRQKVIKVLLILTHIICAWILGENTTVGRNYVFYHFSQMCTGLIVCYICNINTPRRVGAYLYCCLLAGAILQDEPSWLNISAVTLISVLLFIMLKSNENIWLMVTNFCEGNVHEIIDTHSKRRFFKDPAFQVYFVLMFIVTLVYNYFNTNISEMGTCNVKSILLSTLGMCCCSILSANAFGTFMIEISKRVLKFCYFTVSGLLDIEPENIIGLFYISDLYILLADIVIYDMEPFERGQLIISRLLLITAMCIGHCLIIIEATSSKIEIIQGNLLTCMRIIFIHLVFIFVPVILIYVIFGQYRMDNLGIFLTTSFFVTHSICAMFLLCLFILFKYDAVRQNFWDGFDDLVFNIRFSMGIVLILIQICTIVYSLWTLLFGFYRWVDLLMIIGITYTNIYTSAIRLQLVISHKNKIRHFTRNLIDATRDELVEHEDACPICFQEMEEAKVTPCAHLFHESCLQKWLNTRLICPVCQLQIPI
ncbi:RING finger protein 145-like [Mytilus trossulus]|uniref:RING finger protein 145-like n=1 Tax=Mytilus trossulus TaxID=6551 RepID=UPI003004B9C5